MTTRDVVAGSGQGAGVSEYEKFLASKAPRIERTGYDDPVETPHLFPFQRAIVKWATRTGRACIFAGTGLGKTRMQLEWAKRAGRRALVFAPLGVVEQTVAEGAAIGIPVRHSHTADDADGIQITNYQRMHLFPPDGFDALVLDESSILKSVDGKIRTDILERYTAIPRRLACTATPAPNDITELGNHAEFVGACKRAEMLATYFVHDSDGSAKDGWRIKGHAVDAFWRWVARWAVYVRKPSDLGFPDDGFDLPPLHITDERVRTDWKPEGMLLAAGIGGITGRTQVRRATTDSRVGRAVEIIAADSDQWLVWCGLNDEAKKLAKALGDDAVNVEGATDEDEKVALTRRWCAGDVRVMVTKPGIFGFGMNFQHAHKMLFLGMNDSYEQYYQSIRREWRFGQKHPVDVRIVLSTAEDAIAANVKRKEHEAMEATQLAVEAMRDAQIDEVQGVERSVDGYTPAECSGEGWRLMRGDCIERIRELATGSVHMSVFSPPFASLYTYSASDRDLGNCKDYDTFFRQFGFLIPELLRVTMPGRRCAVHVQQVSTTMVSHGVIGWRDFRADTVRAFVAAGWVYDGEVVIDKNPQAQAIRTKAKGLMFVQKERDSAWLRPAMADYILAFRHPGENPVPVKSDVSNEEWIEWAHPVWYGIQESDTLQASAARTDKDEKHVCPLQLGTIERCVRLWSNKGETVFSPFAGIGSEGYQSLKRGRKFVGIELKPEYFTVACRNLADATAQRELFAAP